MKKILIIIGLLIAAGLSFVAYVNLHYEVPILMYHSLDASKVNTYAAVSPRHFYEQMKFIQEHGYNVISLRQYCRCLAANSPFPRKSVVITFDDGYKDNLEAVKILREFAYPATIFVIGNKVGLPGYLSEADITWILRHSQVVIGSHTLNEVYLPDASAATQRREIVDSRRELAKRFDTDVDAFAYTTGGFNEVSLAAVRDGGYSCACTTNRGYDRKLNRFALRRIKVTDHDTAFTLMAKLSGHYNIFRKLKNPY